MSLSRQEELEQYNAFEEIVADLKTRVSDGAGSHAFIGSSKSSKRDSPHVQQAMEDIDDYMRKSYPGSGPNNSWLTCWLHFLADACQLPVREHLRMAKSALQSQDEVNDVCEQHHGGRYDFYASWDEIRRAISALEGELEVLWAIKGQRRPSDEESPEGDEWDEVEAEQYVKYASSYYVQPPLEEEGW